MAGSKIEDFFQDQYQRYQSTTTRTLSREISVAFAEDGDSPDNGRSMGMREKIKHG